MTDPIDAKRQLLAEQLALCERAAQALEHSFGRVDPTRIGEGDPALMETLEALTGRFARLTDILIKRVFRTVVATELADAERLLDVLNFMERLGLIESATQWIEIKELRNAIVHEYAADELSALQRRVYAAVPVLLHVVEAARRYTEKQTAKLGP